MIYHIRKNKTKKQWASEDNLSVLNRIFISITASIIRKMRAIVQIRLINIFPLEMQLSLSAANKIKHKVRFIY